MSVPHSLHRRTFTAAMVVAPTIWLGARAQPAPTLRATPSQTEGPFYPVALPKDSDFDLLRNGDQNYPNGQSTWVEGNVSDLSSKPVAGAQVEIWQCDHDGHYNHPGDGGKADRRFQGFGRVTVSSDGSYRFRTMRPVPYTGRTPHIHVKVKLANRTLLTTQLYVAGDPGNAADHLWLALSQSERAAVTVPFAPDSDGLKARFPIFVVA
jgi:protocatechuate 3,4-dioxygenase, beta subunit